MTRTLRLARETLTELDTDQLRAVAGGEPPPTNNSSCCPEDIVSRKVCTIIETLN